MCNRYRMTASRIDMLRRYGVETFEEPQTLPPPELFPKKPAYVIRQHNGVRMVDTMAWGFPTKGAKTRSNKRTDNMIVRRRK